METRKVLTIVALVLGLMVWPGKLASAEPIGTAFTYQGRLMDANSPADGLYDFQFRLFDDPNVIVGNQVASAIDVDDVDVTDGYFVVPLDFRVVFDGSAVWLEIGVRPGDMNDPNEYTFLEPLQEVTPTPYAIYARTAGVAQSLAAADDSVTPMVYVDNEGNVGIGTNSPTKPLDVDGDVRIDGELEVTGTQASDGVVAAADGFAAGGTTFYEDGWIRIAGNTPNDLLFRIGGSASQSTASDPNQGTEIMRLTATGHLGIGTANPTERLAVNGDIEVENIMMGQGDITDRESIRIIIDRDDNQTEQTFTVWTDGYAGTELFRIQEDGNVGIGTRQPSETLHVAGTVRIADGSEAENRVLTSDADGVASWQEPAGLPRGVIVMWSGSIGNIPSDWALCDGSNGTPDLTSRFVRSVPNASTDPGSTGGSSEHAHDAGSYTASGHTHDFRGATGGPSSTYCCICSCGTDPAAGHTHTHSFSGATDEGGGGTIAGTSGGGSSLPPYYDLAFIMKL